MANDTYYLADDSTNASGAGGSGERLTPDFIAPSVAAATNVAHIIASALQRPLRLVTPFSGAAPYTKVTGALATVALTACPSGIGY